MGSNATNTKLTKLDHLVWLLIPLVFLTKISSSSHRKVDKIRNEEDNLIKYIPSTVTNEKVYSIIHVWEKKRLILTVTGYQLL